jgi:hypothetical protein
MTLKQKCKSFPKLTPVRPAGFSISLDGKGILITGYDKPIVMLIEGKDLDTFENFIKTVKH